MEDLSHYEKEIRPWGNFERFTLNEQTTVKLVTVNAGEAISLQTHEHRDEFWKIITGSGTVTIGTIDYPAAAGDTFFTKRGMHHRVAAGAQPLYFLEIAFGQFDEHDIARLEDRYGRA